MEDVARAEYPGMLVSGPLPPSARSAQPAHWPRGLTDRQQANLQPGQAVQTLNDRVKRINKINIELADWLQVRRRRRVSTRCDLAN